MRANAKRDVIQLMVMRADEEITVWKSKSGTVRVIGASCVFVLTGRAMDSKCPQSSTSPVTLPAANRASR